MSLGLVASRIDATGEAAFAISAVDRDVDALRIAGSAAAPVRRATSISASMTTRAADVATTSLPPPDSSCIGTVLNELAPQAARRARSARACRRRTRMAA